MSPYKGGTSLRDKSLVKRRINKEHNSNFRAGYVHINEERLHRTGIRGRKKWLLIVLIALMMLVAVVNILMTITILGVLKIGHLGIHGLEFIPDALVLKFLKTTVFDADVTILKPLTCFKDDAISLSGKQVSLQAGDKSSMTLNKDNIELKSGHFAVISATTGKSLFSTEFQEINIKEPIKSIESNTVTVPRIVSEVDGNLSVTSDKNITFQGSEGIHADSRNMIIKAENVYLKSHTPSSGPLGSIQESSITLDGRNGLHLNVKKLPLSSFSTTGKLTYKVCACVPSGKVFLVPVTQGGNSCAHANESVDPCA